MILSPHEQELWARFGLSVSDDLWRYEPDHAMTVARIHSKVAKYLEDNHGVRDLYLRKELGFMYFDIAELAVGREVLDAATREAIAVSDRQRKRFQFGPRHAESMYALEGRQDNQ